jgi:N,N-dimethylformamidase
VKRLTGYLLSDSVAAGETLQVAVDSQGRDFTSRLVRIDGPRSDFGDAPWSSTSTIDGCDEATHPGTYRFTQSGSYGYTESVDPLLGETGMAMVVWIWPGMIGPPGTMTLLAQQWIQEFAGFEVGITATGHVSVETWSGANRSSVVSQEPVSKGTWHAIGLSIDREQSAVDFVLARKSAVRGTTLLEARTIERQVHELPSAPALIGLGARLTAQGVVSGRTFEGKIDRPAMWSRPLGMAQLQAAILRQEFTTPPRIEWLFGPAGGQDTNASHVPNQFGAEGDLTLSNRPMVGVTGHLWSGASNDFRLTPAEYSALRLHSDDLADAGWEPTFDVTVPEALESGLYAVELVSEGERDSIPVYVRPSPDRVTEAEVLYLAPTMTYLAYGNDRQHSHVDFGGMTAARPNGPYEDWIDANPQFGSSLYDLHPDGSGWSYSSRQRPLGNVRPDYISWITGYPRHFSADLAIISWLQHSGTRFDVATDHDLHELGLDLLSRYKVVVTGSHPEYVSAEMLDALAEYLAADGRVMYLGGNGFYWATAVAPDGSIEVRRGHAGTRSWESLPGEDVLSLIAEPGGLWRHRGRPPNQLMGIGFAAQGWTGGVPYVVADHLDEGLHKLVFGNLAPGAVVGGFGSFGGAAGDEVDRVDHELGSPESAVVLASSVPFDDGYQPAVEDHPSLTPGIGGSSNRDIRADMTYVNHADGGAVFSVGSINWSSCLPVNGFDNDIAMISTNVLEAFIRGEI